MAEEQKQATAPSAPPRRDGGGGHGGGHSGGGHRGGGHRGGSHRRPRRERGGAALVPADPVVGSANIFARRRSASFAWRRWTSSTTSARTFCRSLCRNAARFCPGA